MKSRTFLFSVCATLSLATAGCSQAEAPLDFLPTQETAPPAAVNEETVSSETKQETAQAENLLQPKMVDGYEEIVWEDMMPPGEEERLMRMLADLQASGGGYGGIVEGSADDKAVQIGTFNTVSDLDGVKIRLPGYTVPFDYTPDARITEFLLVPYFGACLHAPPPPPNQTLYVQSETPIRIGDLAQAVWVYGTIHVKTQTTDLADTAYTLSLDKVEDYQY